MENNIGPNPLPLLILVIHLLAWGAFENLALQALVTLLFLSYAKMENLSEHTAF